MPSFDSTIILPLRKIINCHKVEPLAVFSISVPVYQEHYKGYEWCQCNRVAPVFYHTKQLNQKSNRQSQSKPDSKTHWGQLADHARVRHDDQDRPHWGLRSNWSGSTLVNIYSHMGRLKVRLELCTFYLYSTIAGEEGLTHCVRYINNPKTTHQSLPCQFWSSKYT